MAPLAWWSWLGLRHPGRRCRSHRERPHDPNFYGNSYLKLAFSVDYWGTRNYLAQVSQSMLSTSPFNETHWPAQSGVGRTTPSSTVRRWLRSTHQSAKRSFTKCRPSNTMTVAISSVLPRLDGCLLEPSCGLESQQGDASARLLWPRLPKHLVHLNCLAALHPGCPAC